MTINTPKTLEHLRVASLRTYDRNARTHSPQQIAQLVANVRTFGWTNPLIVDEDNQIIAGHGRLVAAQELEMETVPCIRVTGLTEHQKKALVLSDNKIALNAGWDDKLLAEELQAIQFAIDSEELDFKIDEVLGFALPEVEEILKVLAEPEEEPPPDPIMVEPEPTVTLYAADDRLVVLDTGGRVLTYGYDGTPLTDHALSTATQRQVLGTEGIVITTGGTIRYSRDWGATWTTASPLPYPQALFPTRLF